MVSEDAAGARIQSLERALREKDESIETLQEMLSIAKESWAAANTQLCDEKEEVERELVDTKMQVGLLYAWSYLSLTKQTGVVVRSPVVSLSEKLVELMTSKGAMETSRNSSKSNKQKHVDATTVKRRPFGQSQHWILNRGF